MSAAACGPAINITPQSLVRSRISTSFAKDVAVEMFCEPLRLPGNRIDNDRRWPGKNEHVRQDVPLGVENEGFGPAARTEIANIVGAEIVQKGRAVVAGQIELRAAREIDQSRGFDERAVAGRNRGEIGGGHDDSWKCLTVGGCRQDALGVGE